MVYSSVLQPLLIGPEVAPDQAIFAIGLLLAACTFAYYCKSKTHAAKWAAFFMALLCVWAHAFAFVALRLHGGIEVEGWELVRVGAGALVLVTFGALWVRALRVRHDKAPP